MSTSMLVFRLEIAEKSKLPHLNYSAESYVQLKSRAKQSYSDALSAGLALTKKKIKTHRGKRELQSITIETFDMSSAKPEESKSESEMLNSRSDLTEVKSDMEIVADVNDETDGKEFVNESSEQTNTESYKQAIEQQIKGAIGLDCDTKPSGSRPSSAKMKSVSYKSAAKSTTPLSFSSGNPSVECTEGIVHIYKENTPQTGSHSSQMLCMIMVPSTMTSQDFLQFVSPVESWLEHIKIVRDGAPNRYMVLLKFRNQSHTDDFYKNFNNQPFNSIEPEVCHLAYVSHIECMKESDATGLPLQGITELPVCPVCLERMDESVDGILTVLCNHSFHTCCLSQWGDTSCPVCRYVQTPELVEDNKCFQCNNKENLWICLICGHVGCGRYASGHAHSHFNETQHTYSMQLGSQRVWDYAGDNYVHRLVQSKDDGKLVEVGESRGDTDEEKVDSITLEYTYLLTSQLEKQRLYFEERIEQIEKEALKQVSEAESQSKTVIDKCSQLENQLQQKTDKNIQYEKKVLQLQKELDRLGKSVSNEEQISKSLLANQSQWQDKVNDMEIDIKSKNKEISELKEQVRDVMFFMEAQQKLSNTTICSQQEIAEASVVVDRNKSHSSGRKHKKKR